MSPQDVLKLIEEQEIKFVDLRFTDTRGKENHLTLPLVAVDESLFDDGKAFDGSSIAGWKDIHQSDMLLMPEAKTAVIDPFTDEKTLIIRCDVLDPDSGEGYERCPRSIAKKAESYLKATGIADAAYFGPEPEFYVFDSVTWHTGMNRSFYEIDSEEGSWSSAKAFEGGNLGHRPQVKGGYFPVPPVDSLQDLRSAMCMTLAEMGVEVEVHHHEVGGAGQCEIGTRFDTLVARADSVQILKYVIHNVANEYGKTVTFMPKPIFGDNGSGMHVHQSLARGGENLFSGNDYAGLSTTALYYIGGILHHAKAINAFANPTTNSYKRLVPGFEAPVLLAYSSRNRSASVRIPHVPSPKARRIEVRFPDPQANPYLAFAAMLMAGLDGIENKIHPGEPMDKNLYDLPPEETRAIPSVAVSLEEALNALDKQRDFLLKGGVFDNDMIDGFLQLKRQEVQMVRMSPHPLEFQLYYSL